MPSISKNHYQDPVLVAFGETIRSLRLKKGLSQEQLAFLTSMDRIYMCGIELGENNITLLKMYKIAEALNMSLAELLRKVKI